jgi:Ca2+-binding RTX toxin-like protein
MIGGAGDDTYYVDTRKDKAVEGVGAGTDTVYSSVTYVLMDNVENLVLTETRNIAGTGNDLGNEMTGNVGSNRLTGGLGADTMTGGLGSDTFIWNSVADSPAGVGTYDVVTDFNAAERDRLDVRGIDADTAKPGNQKFHFIGTNAFSSTDATGELRFDAATHMLYGSVNADANPEFAVQLTGVNELLVTSIML